MTDYVTIRVDTDGPLSTLTMNRPDRLNGMTNQMLEETHEALLALAADPAVRVLVLTGAGRGFCPGADLKHFTGGEPDVEISTDRFRVPVLLHEMPAVTVAAINGACAGAGLGWAAACDFRFAARSANFTTAFLNVAVAGDMGLPWSLPRLIGAARARELSFFPDKFSADEAYRTGLVTDVFDDDRFREEVATRVDRLVAAPPVALRALKAHYVAAERMGFGDLVDLETARHRVIARSPETAAAFRAFVERPRPEPAASRR
jgi:2-(1,2-epoxy-1,2-dihydrophenyl)acetyl-CoA isomerase